MAVESREPIMHSGFFRLKHTSIIAEQKKLHMEGFCRGLSSQKCLSDHGKIVTKYAAEGFNPKNIFISKSYREINSHHLRSFPD